MELQNVEKNWRLGKVYQCLGHASLIVFVLPDALLMEVDAKDADPDPVQPELLPELVFMPTIGKIH